MVLKSALSGSLYSSLRLCRRCYDYCWKSNKQTELAHALIDAGADLVIGHGAHVMQEIELYRRRWVVYGLGNFMFMSPGRYQKKNVEPFSLAARLDVSENKEGFLASLRLYPLFSDNRQTMYQPRVVTEQEFEKVKALLLQHSPGSEKLKNKMSTGNDEVGRFISLNVSLEKLF